MIFLQLNTRRSNKKILFIKKSLDILINHVRSSLQVCCESIRVAFLPNLFFFSFFSFFPSSPSSSPPPSCFYLFQISPSDLYTLEIRLLLLSLFAHSAHSAHPHSSATPRTRRIRRCDLRPRDHGRGDARAVGAHYLLTPRTSHISEQTQ